MAERLGPKRAQSCTRRTDGRFTFDLWQANVDELILAGVPAGQIHLAGVCTICRADLFASYRVEGDRAGRFCAVIAASSPRR
jgi:copper oxidase (laccase) domain-containing protein